MTEEAIKNAGGPKRPWTDFFVDEAGNYWIIDSERNLHHKRDGKWRKTLNLDTFRKEEVWNISISPDGQCFHILYGSGKAYCIESATLQTRTIYSAPKDMLCAEKQDGKRGKCILR